MRRAVEAGLIQRRLADQRDGLRQVAVDLLGGRGRAVVPEDARDFFETAFRRFVEDFADATRMRIEEDDGVGGQRAVHGEAGIVGVRFQRTMRGRWPRAGSRSRTP